MITKMNSKINTSEFVQFVEKENNELYSLKVLKGPFKGVIYTYGKVQITGTEETPVLKFDYTIESAPKPKKKSKLKKSKTFKNFMGDVLTSILTDHINDESTKTDNKESDEG